jgi:membrane-bound inhibitor of C-type lysozyme
MTMINTVDVSRVPHPAVIFSDIYFSVRLSAALLITVFALFAVAGCISSADQKNKWAFTCPDGYKFTAVFSRGGESVTLEDESQKLKLDIERSASGARYTDGTTIFWNKGVMARIESGEGVIHQDCQGDSN